jgi:hypothetical protein
MQLQQQNTLRQAQEHQQRALQQLQQQQQQQQQQRAGIGDQRQRFLSRESGQLDRP